ncbi:transcriptional regulator [Companilactobacillus crustorum]|uniref:Transcriptional regulator n=3 Tax=Companilactobacillus TaxID=2767879 RepID=A0A837RF87_9LACO|nr:MerR family transcriptional regulator [Companilactobacillus crustorum]KRK41501.1 transcriptional regulator [Companilactobacillus crustorum JCM 15951]KRO19649.1 transcriptional regulator [Companilactobacillus crustorum]GEO77126.1 transcriptional regulator [Companilactobacillus crustorum]
MSEYTTGELAKMFDVSIRTIQFYDKKGILKPSHISENGKRIYTEEDVSRLKLILMLKNLGLPLKAIGEILASDNSMIVLDLLLEQRLRAAKDQVSLRTIDDIDKIMSNKKALRKVHMKMVILGLLMDVAEIGGLVWGIKKGQWVPFILIMLLAIIFAIWITKYYFNSVNYICPNCNYEFRPKFRAAFFSNHNPKARKLVCPNCHQKNYCIEVYAGEADVKIAE